jgi:hypothetical protein
MASLNVEFKRGATVKRSNSEILAGACGSIALIFAGAGSFSRQYERTVKQVLNQGVRRFGLARR